MGHYVYACAHAKLQRMRSLKNAVKLPWLTTNCITKMLHWCKRYPPAARVPGRLAVRPAGGCQRPGGQVSQAPPEGSI